MPATASPSRPPVATHPFPNPFVGPRSIRAGEALHGRAPEVRELFDRLQARRIVLLHSPSGAGKSSLVAAGLIPRLREAQFDVWRTIRVNLDPSGLEGVPAEANRYLLSTLLSLEEELPDERQRSPAELAGMDLLTYLQNRPRRKGAAGRSPVLIFDQFEEVLTIAPRAVAEKREFFTSVGRALDTGDYWALFIVREDYLGALAPYRDRVPTQLANTFRLDLLSLDAAREAAVALARTGGRTFPGVEHLVTELSTLLVQQAEGDPAREQGLYVEPVQLQVVCHRLWDAMPADDSSIDAEDITAYADVSKALGGYYDTSLSRIAAGDVGLERRLRDWVGTKLIVAGIRSQVRQGVGETAGLDNGLIEKLKDSYLVRSDTRAGATWFELSHDRLVEPVTLHNQAWEEEHLHAMQVQAGLWAKSERSPALLLSEAALVEAQRWAEANGSLMKEVERRFLAVSAETRAAEARARRRWWVVTAVLVGLVVLAVGAMGFAWEKAAEAELSAASAREKGRIAEDNEKIAERAVDDLEATQVELKQALTDAEKATRDATRSAAEAAEQARAARLAQQRSLDQARLASALFAPTVTAKVALLREQDPTRAPPRGWEGTAEQALQAPGREVGRWRVPEDEVVIGVHPCLAWTPGQQRAASSCPSRALIVTDFGRIGKLAHTVWSPDQYRAWVWDAVTGEKVASLTGHQLDVTHASFSPDGRRVVTASLDGTVRIWEASSGEALAVLDLKLGDRQLRRGPWVAAAATFSPDGRRVLVTSTVGPAQVWDPEADTGERLIVLRDGAEHVECLFASFSPDGRRVVTTSLDGVARVWDVDRPGVLVAIRVHEPATKHPDPALLTASFSPDGRRVVTTSTDGFARVWDANSGAPLLALEGHTDGVLAASYSPDGQWIVTASLDHSARVWDARSGVSVATLIGHGTSVLSARFSPDSRQVVTTANDGTARVWYLARNWHSGYAPRAVVASSSPDGRSLVAGYVDGSVRGWDLAKGQVVLMLAVSREPVRSASFSPDGRQVVTTSADGVAQVWDGATGSMVLSLDQDDVRSASFSPDSHRLVTSHQGGSAQVWDLISGSSVLTLKRRGDEGHEETSPVTSASYSPDGRWLVTGHADCTARLWDANTGSELRGFGSPPKPWHDGDCAVWSASFSPDSRLVITASEHGRAQVWEADSGEAGLTIVPPYPIERPWSASFSPSGQHVLTSMEHDIPRLWDASSGEQFVLKPTYHRNLQGYGTFSPDGRLLITAHEDGAVRRWDPASHEVVQELAHHDDLIWSAPSSSGNQPQDPRLGRGPSPEHRMLGALWCATPLCLSPAERTELLLESPAEAARGASNCQSEVARRAPDCRYPWADVTLFDGQGPPYPLSPQPASP
jgi:WD40 repeat protein